MTRYICIAGSKGGIGRTTTAISLAHIMGKHEKILLVDANLTKPNINTHLGAPILRKTLMHVLRDESSLYQAIYRHTSGLRILPNITTIEDLKRLKYERLRHLMRRLGREAEIIILDSAAGLGREAITAIEAADEILFLTTPDLSSVLDTQKTIQVAHEIGKTILGVVVNQYRGDKHDLNVADIEKLLDLPVIGVIPFDDNVRKALKLKHPVTYAYPHTKASKSYEEIAGLLLGKKYFESINKKSKTMQDYILDMLGMA